MKYALLLTLILFVLKFLGHVSLSAWEAFLPVPITFGLILFIKLINVIYDIMEESKGTA